MRDPCWRTTFEKEQACLEKCLLTMSKYLLTCGSCEACSMHSDPGFANQGDRGDVGDPHLRKNVKHIRNGVSYPKPGF